MSNYWRVCYRTLHAERRFLYSTTSETSARETVRELNAELSTDRFYVEFEGSDYAPREV